MNKFETERLILRTWNEKDIEPFCRMNQDPKVLEFLTGPPCTLETAKTAIEGIQKHIQAHGFGIWAVELKATGEFIGHVGLSTQTFAADFTPCVEIGWRLDSHFWGHGYATEAAKRVLEIGFQEFGLKEIVSFTVPANRRSIQVMENIGMRRDFNGDFYHPKVPEGHPLSLHILYRKSADS